MHAPPTREVRPSSSSARARWLTAGGVGGLVLLTAGFVWASASPSDGAGPAGPELAPSSSAAGASPFHTTEGVGTPSVGTRSMADRVDELPPSGLALPVAADPTPSAIAAAATRRQECDPYYVEEPHQIPRRNFYFARGMYSSGFGGFYGRSWRVDFPKADRQFAYVMERTLGWDIHPCETPVGLDDPLLRRYPFVYLLEVGGMGLSEAEVEGFREYLLAGGFAFIDDFWGQYEWANFEREIRRVLPDHEIEEIPPDHLIYRIVYPIEEVLQVPNVGNGRRGDPNYYGECGGAPCPATIRGIFDDDDRLMVLIAHNTDMGDAWEWAEDPYYPYDRSNYAFSLAFNAITYAMTY